VVFILNRLLFKRIKSLFIIFLVAFAFLSGRITHLQIIQGQKLAAMGEKIHSQFIQGEELPRGDIVDRNLVSLLDTGEREAAVIFPAIFEKEDAAKLSQILQLPIKKITDKLETAKNYYGNNPIIIKTNLVTSEIENLKKANLQGVYLIPIQSRYGPNSLAVHLVGHMGTIDQITWEKLIPKNSELSGSKPYQRDDLIGVKGIEAIYEEYLRSTKASHYLQATVDALGRPLLGLGFSKIVNQSEINKRNKVVLTIDARIQNIVENVMDKHIAKGAIVVLDNSSGEIVAIASRPKFDQNQIDKYLNSNLRTEFLNRAFLHYFPGSVFKLLIAAAALEEGVTDLTEVFECTGEYQFESGLVIPCWYEEGHGKLTFAEALAHSCNPVFIEVGQRLGAEKIIEYAHRFKLDEDDLIGYPLENYSSINIDEQSPAAIGNAALGQKGIKLSPLQVTKMYATVANDGVYKIPRIVNRIETNQHRLIKAFLPGQDIQVISSKTAKELKKMLVMATTSGTATKAWIEKCGSAGKTSTAQTGEQSVAGKEKMNVWFAGFAPLDHPKYTVTIMIEDGTSGGRDAAPVFKEIMVQILDL